MNILKPQKLVLDKLIKTNNLSNTEEDEKISNINLESFKKDNIELNDITIEKSIITNTEIINSNCAPSKG